MVQIYKLLTTSTRLAQVARAFEFWKNAQEEQSGTGKRDHERVVAQEPTGAWRGKYKPAAYTSVCTCQSICKDYTVAPLVQLEATT